MITESRDLSTGFVRFEINTTRIDLCRAEIEKTGFVKLKDGVADTINYDIMYKGLCLRAMTQETRLVLWGENRFAMLEFIELISGDERIGTNWAYDDSSRSDYQRK